LKHNSGLRGLKYIFPQCSIQVVFHTLDSFQNVFPNRYVFSQTLCMKHKSSYFYKDARWFLII